MQLVTWRALSMSPYLRAQRRLGRVRAHKHQRGQPLHEGLARRGWAPLHLNSSVIEVLHDPQPRGQIL